MLLFMLASSIMAPAQADSGERNGLSAARLHRVNELVQRNIDAGEITGAVSLVARNGRIEYLVAQGVSDLARSAPMKKDAIFRIASMSKPITAVAVLMLVESGRMRLTDPLSRFIPAFRNLAVNVSRPPAPALALPPPGATPPPPQTFLVPAAREVTVLDVLTHTSGIMSGPMSTAAGDALLQGRQPRGLKWTEDLAVVPLEFQPGSQWAYSPIAGFDLLAHLVEIVSGQSFDEFTAENIFRPLDMRETFFWPNDAERARLVGNYVKSANGLTARENPDALSGERYFAGSGGLMSTAESYARFGMMLANGGELNGVRLLSPRSVELMCSAFIPDTLPGRSPGEGFGLGVRTITDPVARITTLSKGSFGWSGAYGTHFFVDPTRKLVGILMIQTPAYPMRGDFEDAVMQAVVR